MPHPPLENITFILPVGTNNHSDNHLICTPAQITDLAEFFLANFAAHAITVKSLPGEPLVSYLLAMLLALFFPTSAVLRSIFAIYRLAIFKNTPLERASSCGALCAVVKKSEEETTEEAIDENTEHKGSVNPPRETSVSRVKRAPTASAFSDPFRGIQEDQSEKLKDWQKWTSLQVYLTPFHESDTFEPTERTFSLHGRKVHGICKLPEGYALKLLPTDTRVHERKQVEETRDESNFWMRLVKRAISSLKSVCLGEKEEPNLEYSINSTYSFAKAAIAIFQTVYASFTLYQTRGDQLRRYGYAAFGLTVTPYVIMSILNLICALVTPDYNHVYMVESPLMNEARTAGGKFVGTVGSLEKKSAAPKPPGVRAGSVSSGDSPVRAIRHSGTLSRSVSEHAERKADDASVQPTATNEDYNGPQIPSTLSGRKGPKPVVSPPPKDSPVEAHEAAKKHKIRQAIGLFLACIFVGCFAFAIIGGISRFKPNKSTRPQRIWTMLWLSFGVVVGPIPLLRVLATVRHGTKYYWIVDVILAIFCAPAIGGYIVVGEMLKEYGTCVRIY